MPDKEKDNIERAIPKTVNLVDSPMVEAKALSFIYKTPEFIHEVLGVIGKGQNPKSMALSTAEAMRDPEFMDGLPATLIWALKNSKNVKGE